MSLSPFRCLKGLWGIFPKIFLAWQPGCGIHKGTTLLYFTVLFIPDASFRIEILSTTLGGTQRPPCHPSAPEQGLSASSPLSFSLHLILTPIKYFLLGVCFSVLDAFSLTPLAIREQKFVHLPEIRRHLVLIYKVAEAFPRINKPCQSLWWALGRRQSSQDLTTHSIFKMVSFPLLSDHGTRRMEIALIQ